MKRGMLTITMLCGIQSQPFFCVFCVLRPIIFYSTSASYKVTLLPLSHFISPISHLSRSHKRYISIAKKNKSIPSSSSSSSFSIFDPERINPLFTVRLFVPPLLHYLMIPFVALFLVRISYLPISQKPRKTNSANSFFPEAETNEHSTIFSNEGWSGGGGTKATRM